MATEIGELNRRITLKSWTSTQDEGGGSSAVNVASYIIWAKVEARNGTPFINEEQQVWNYDYRVTFRYERSRVPQSNFTIDYDSKRLKINSVSFEQEGVRKWCVARCNTEDANIDTDNDISILTTLGTFDYYGIGGEDEFTAASTITPIGAPPTVPKDLRNKTIIGAFKDGIEFNVILGGSFDPVVKQVLYVPATGRFLWSLPYEPSEHTLIQYF